jgi:hypothetical protein
MGVRIAMTRFNEIKVDTAAAAVEVGSSLTWDQVCATLESWRKCRRGTCTGTGVAGLSLGRAEYLPSSDDPIDFEM